MLKTVTCLRHSQAKRTGSYPELKGEQLIEDEECVSERSKSVYVPTNPMTEMTVQSVPVRKKFQRPLPRLPFCEEYDGVNLRKTTTISQSIIELMAVQKKRRQEEEVKSNEVDEEEGKSKEEATYETTALERSEDVKDTTELIRRISFEYDNIPTPTDSGIHTNFESDCASLASSVDPFEDVHIRRVDKKIICSIDLKLRFLSNSNQLDLCVVQAEDVHDTKSPKKLIDTFVKVSMFHRKKTYAKKQKSSVVHKSRDPVFMHTFYLDNVVEKWMHLMCVRVQLYEKKRFWSCCIGETLIWLDDLDLVCGEPVGVTENLTKPYL